MEKSGWGDDRGGYFGLGMAVWGDKKEEEIMGIGYKVGMIVY